jgi:hypothetical protein
MKRKGLVLFESPLLSVTEHVIHLLETKDESHAVIFSSCPGQAARRRLQLFLPQLAVRVAYVCRVSHCQ